MPRSNVSMEMRVRRAMVENLDNNFSDVADLTPIFDVNNGGIPAATPAGNRQRAAERTISRDSFRSPWTREVRGTKESLGMWLAGRDSATDDLVFD